MRKERQYEGSKDCFAQAGGHGERRVCACLLGWAYAALTFTLAVAVAFGARMPRAFAANQYDPEMVIDGNLVDGTYKGYMCVNANRFTATLELIGKMGDYVSIDTEKYNRLNAAGAFRICMDRWQELTEDSNEDIENSWLGGDAFIDGWLILSGKGNCWYGTYTDQQIQDALSYYETVMEGGGGSSGGAGSPEDSVTGQDGNYVYVDAELTGSAQSYMGMDIVGYAFPKSKWAQVVSGIEDSSMLYLVFGGARGAQTGLYSSEKVDIQPSYSSSTMFDYHGTYRAYSSAGAMQIYNNKMYMVVDVNVAYDSTRVDDYTLTAPVAAARTVYMYAWIGESEPEPDPEPKPEPEPDPDTPSPTPPDPPTLPDPKDPTVPRTPEPETPTPEPSTPRLPDPIVVTVPTNTSPTDYTPWLEAILRELQGIHTDMADYLQEFLDEMSNHCLHLREEMATQAGYIGECLDVVAQTSAGVGDQVESAIWDYAEWLAEYLDGLAEWMVEHMSFNTTVENNVTADPYDDTSLMYWLRRIYTKLGAGGPVSTKPTDPTSDPNGTNDWLTRLWQNFLTALSDLIPSVDLGNSLDALKTKFPFSIPWDVLAIMTMLVAPAQTPDVDIPQYALDANGDIQLVGTYEIDLEDYDAAMGGVRLILKISFVVFLMVHTKDFMELIEAVIPT